VVELGELFGNREISPRLQTEAAIREKRQFLCERRIRGKIFDEDRFSGDGEIRQSLEKCLGCGPSSYIALLRAGCGDLIRRGVVEIHGTLPVSMAA